MAGVSLGAIIVGAIIGAGVGGVAQAQKTGELSWEGPVFGGLAGAAGGAAGGALTGAGGGAVGGEVGGALPSVGMVAASDAAVGGSVGGSVGSVAGATVGGTTASELILPTAMNQAAAMGGYITAPVELAGGSAASSLIPGISNSTLLQAGTQLVGPALNMAMGQPSMPEPLAAIPPSIIDDPVAARREADREPLSPLEIDRRNKARAATRAAFAEKVRAEEEAQIASLVGIQSAYDDRARYLQPRTAQERREGIQPRPGRYRFSV